MTDVFLALLALAVLTAPVACAAVSAASAAPAPAVAAVAVVFSTVVDLVVLGEEEAVRSSDVTRIRCVSSPP